MEAFFSVDSTDPKLSTSTCFSDFKSAVESFCQKYCRPDASHFGGDFHIYFNAGIFEVNLSIADLLSYAYACGYENG